jgi:DNA primase
MALPAHFLDELRARTPLPAVIARRVKLARSGRQWKGCCPFHGEKSPSFYVYDDHYHCFGCGEHGDAVSFVMKTQNASFPEAVEQLAAEAGLDVPKPSPAVAAAERRRHDLHSVLEAAAAVYRRNLFAPEGARALAYLRGRGLSDATIARFGLGWSGEGRGALARELAADEVTPAMLLAAGLLRPGGDGRGEDGRPGQELFYNRVMFPIRDRRGRAISFGGRILGDGQPKYVNGPETEVFSKRRTLFALDLAREAARSGSPVVAVEGYMDVIALHQAGFAGAVAPLGTALTDDQLAELWRLSDAPVLCFDGDAAGGRAAGRAAELALPLLSVGRTLRFAALPPGEDPDSLVRKRGVSDFRALVDAARPHIDALFSLLRETTGDASPEQRAALSARLEAAAGLIADRSLAWEYRAALRQKLRDSRPSFARGSFPRGGGRQTPKLAIARPAADGDFVAAERGRLLVATLLRHPDLLHDVEEAFGMVALAPDMARLRDAMVRWAELHALRHQEGGEALDSAGLMDHLTEAGLATAAAQALGVAPLPQATFAMPGAMPAEAEAGWWHIFGLMHRNRLEEEVTAAMREFTTRPDEANQRRLTALCTARNALRRGEQEFEPEENGYEDSDANASETGQAWASELGDGPLAEDGVADD